MNRYLAPDPRYPAYQKRVGINPRSPRQRIAGCPAQQLLNLVGEGIWMLHGPYCTGYYRGMSHRALDPAALALPEAYQLLNVCVAPRPIAFVSTLSADGKQNLAPFSYFMAGGANPPSVAISPVGNRDGSPKDTLANIEATGEFTISIVTYAMREKMNQASFAYPHGVSEWAEVGFTQGATEVVKSARVLESPLALECRLFQIVPHGPGPLSAHYIIGEVVRYWVAEALLGSDGHIDPTKIDYIARMSGDWYARAQPEALFELPRP